MSKDAYIGTNYPAQADAAARMWDGPPDSEVIIAVDPASEKTAAIVWLKHGDGKFEPIFDLSYPKALPDHPGPRPPWWRRRARREWETMRAARQAAKRHNFALIYGAGRESIVAAGHD